MKKIVNKKLVLNKQKISELSQDNLGDIKGGKPLTWKWTRWCVVETRDRRCLISDLYTGCYCETDWKGCDTVTIP